MRFEYRKNLAAIVTVAAAFNDHVVLTTETHTWMVCPEKFTRVHPKFAFFFS